MIKSRETAPFFQGTHPRKGRDGMYLHIGASVVIPEQDVLGIFDLDNTTSSRITRNFLAQAQQAGR